MPIFDYQDNEALGTVLSVDTAMVVVKVTDTQKLRQLQVNRLSVLQSSRPGQHLVGVIQKITRSVSSPTPETEADEDADAMLANGELNLVRITLIGTLVDKQGRRENVFLRTLETVPEIDANCFAVEGERLSAFMRVIANVAGDGQKLSLGRYTIDDFAEAYLNGNKFFQRHATIVGSTGSGKSWTTARLLEQVSELPQANAIVFDIHGEYSPLAGDGFQHYRIAGSGDLSGTKSLEDGVIFLPYWLLGYEALVSMFVDRSDQNAPNQSMLISRTIIEAKRSVLAEGGHVEILDNFTVDSPVPFRIIPVMTRLNNLNTEMVIGSAGKEKQGDFHGKLSRLIARLDAKMTDRRLGFLFQPPESTFAFSWLEDLVAALISGRADRPGKTGGVKIIDFSEVPSDVLPLIVSLVAKLAFSVQQWTAPQKRHPIALVCDEAHLYIPERSLSDATGDVSVEIFERIAKEGRKYGIGLVVVSQRPSEVNPTVLSQCNNLVAMRLTNGKDQAVIRRLLPDSLGSFGDLLPILDTGEALVVGDASLLPSRIRISEPSSKPNSGTVEFWDRWSSVTAIGGLQKAVESWRRQTVK